MGHGNVRTTGEGRAALHRNTRNSNRRRRSACLLFFFFLLAIVIENCSLPQRPGDWSWDTHLTVPLGVRTYGVWEMVSSDFEIRRDGSGIGMEEDSSTFFSAFEELEVDFKDSLYLDPTSYTLTKPVTALFLPVNVDQTNEFSLGRLNPDIAALHGSIQDLPPHNLNASAQLSFGSGVDHFVVDTGSVLITISNTLAYGVSELSLAASDFSGIEQLLIGEISLAAGAQVTLPAELDDIHFLQTTSLILTATGDGGLGIVVDSARGLTIMTSIDTLQVAPYYGIIPPQPFYADSLFPMTQRHRLFEGIIDSGNVTVTAINETQLDDTVWIVFPKLFNPLGDSLVSKQFVPAGETRSDTIELAGYRMRLFNETPQRIELRMLSWSSETPDHREFEPGGEFVAGNVSCSQLFFSYFDGVVDELALDFPVEGTTIEQPPDGWESAHPTTVDAYVTILSGLEATADSRINIQTYLDGIGLTSSLFEIDDVSLGTDTTLVFHDLAELLNQYPDSMDATGTITVSGPIKTYETESIVVEIDLQAPLRFTLDSLHAPGKIQKVESSDLEDIQSGSARVRIWNRLPIGGRVYLVAARDSANVDYDSHLPADTVANTEIPVSEIVDGRATGEAYTELTVTLSDNLLEYLRNPPFFTRTDIALPSSNGDTLTVHGTDFVKVQVIADIIYRIHTGDDE